MGIPPQGPPRLPLAFAAALALCACQPPEPDRAEREAWEANQAAANQAAPLPPEPEPEEPPPPLEPDPPGTRWETGASGEGASLILATPARERRLTLFCRPRSGEILVNVPRFRASRGAGPISLTAGGETILLDSDAARDPRRGGVSGTMALSDDLSAMLRGRDPISVVYGAQTSGPHGPMLPEIAAGFVAACRPARQ